LQSILFQTTTVYNIYIYEEYSTAQYCDCATHSGMHQSFAENFCSAVARSTEDILFLCDQDDIWEVNKVEVLKGCLSTDDVDMVFSDGITIDATGTKLNTASVLESYGLNKPAMEQFNADPFKQLIRKNYVNGAAAALRRNAALQALPLPCDMPHDFWFAIFLSLNNRILATPEILYRYRQHDNNVIGLGKGSLKYLGWSLWQCSDAPRERELRLWQAITLELSKTWDSKNIFLA
jgi:hypothetical protein